MLLTILILDLLAITLVPYIIYSFLKQRDKNIASTLRENSFFLKKKTDLFFATPINIGINTQKMYSAIIMFILIFSSITLSAYEKYSNVKIYMPKEKEQLLDLLALLEIDHYHEHDGTFNYTVSETEMQRLKKSEYKYEVIHEDAIAYLEEENKKYYESIKINPSNRVAFERTGDIVDSIINTPSAFIVQPTMGGYYRLGQMDTAIRTLKSTYPTLVDTFTIGYTTENRPIKCLKISDNPTSDESDPEILFMGHHHAREAIGGSSMIFLMQYLCQNYFTDTRIRDLVDNREIFIIVCSNPDGWEYNRSTNPTGGGQWRKNKSVNTGCSGCFGVDLNRNWGVSWSDSVGAIGGTSVGTGAPASNTYWGPSMYSEPETKALRTFCRQRDFVAVMDQHSVGPYYSLPWGRSYNIMSGLDDSVYRQMSSVMGKYNGMRYGNTMQTLGYEVTGGMKDLLLRGDDSLPNGKCYGMTGEGSNGSSVTQFWPIAADIVKLCKGMVYQDLQLMYTIGSYVDLQDTGTINLQATTGKFYFKLRRIGLANEPVTISVIPIQNVFSVGGSKSISLTRFNDTSVDSISYVLSSSIAAGNSIKFAYRIETSGQTYYDTITKIYRGNTLFTDNMEGALASTNWTINSGWAYTNDQAYSGTKSLAESPGNANYADNVNLIAQKTTNLNLSGSGTAYISFWVKYRTENFRDLLRVEVSTNGTTWVSLIGKNTVREPGSLDGNRLGDTSALTGLNEFWSREIYDLGNYLTATNLRIRFRFNSGANTIYTYDNDAGFNIDDITIVTGGVPMLLPVELTTFTGHNQGNINVLDWNTASELNTSQFVIERSVNGVDYETIGTVLAAGNSSTTKNYSFIDTNPYNGENLYRLRMEDLDETFKYSKLVSIKVQNETALIPSGIEKMYPNPTNGKMYINFLVTDEQETFQHNVFNSFGQSMKTELMTLTIGQHIIELDASDFAKGQYFVTFTSPSKGLTYENTFLKM